MRGDRITIHYSRRYSFSQEIWDEMRKLKREEGRQRVLLRDDIIILCTINLNLLLQHTQNCLSVLIVFDITFFLSANSINGRDADDSLGNWWDEEGMESGSLQRETGNILWDDGSLW